MGFHLRLRFHIPDISNVFNVILVVNEYFSPLLIMMWLLSNMTLT